MSEHLSPFKPGVRYFVLPNAEELDPPQTRSRATTTVDLVREALREQPRTQRDLIATLPASAQAISSALYGMLQRGVIREVAQRLRPENCHGRTSERVYGLVQP